MDSRFKMYISAVLFLFSMGVVGIRFQQSILLGVSCLSLFSVTLYFRSALSSITLIGVLSMLYQGARFDYIYGADAHSVSVVATRIANSGWPIQNTTIAGGFPGTPLIHIHAAMLGIVGDLPMFSIGANSTNPLAQALLPFIYVLSLIAMVYAISGRLYSAELRPILSLPIVLWIPIYYWVSFRRQTIGYVLFVLAVYGSIIYVSHKNDKKTILIPLLSLGLIPLSHHLSTALLVIFLVGLVISYYIVEPGAAGRPAHLLVMMSAFSLLWYLWGTGGATEMVVLFGSAASSLFDVTSSTATGGVERTFLVNFRVFYSKWLYQMLLALGVVLALVVKYRDSKINQVELSIFFFGAIIGALALLGISLSALPTVRLMTFFVLLGGIVTVYGWIEFSKLTNTPVTSIALILLLVLSVSMVPPHLVSDTRPSYEQGIDSQQINKELYHTSHWLYLYQSDSVAYGDIIVREVTTPISQTRVDPDARFVREGDLPTGYIVYRSANDVVYRGWLPNQAVLIGAVPSRGLQEMTSLKNSKIYSTNETVVYL